MGSLTGDAAPLNCETRDGPRVGSCSQIARSSLCGSVFGQQSVKRRTLTDMVVPCRSFWQVTRLEGRAEIEIETRITTETCIISLGETTIICYAGSFDTGDAAPINCDHRGVGLAGPALRLLEPAAALPTAGTLLLEPVALPTAGAPFLLPALPNGTFCGLNREIRQRLDLGCWLGGCVCHVVRHWPRPTARG